CLFSRRRYPCPRNVCHRTPATAARRWRPPDPAPWRYDGCVDSRSLALSPCRSRFRLLTKVLAHDIEHAPQRLDIVLIKPGQGAAASLLRQPAQIIQRRLRRLGEIEPETAAVVRIYPTFHQPFLFKTVQLPGQ